MSISLKQYTMRYLIIAILAIITIWASLFYAFILDEVYDNVDDGLRNQKILILREAYEDPSILNTPEYGVNQFRITPVREDNFNEHNLFTNEMYYMPYDEDDEPYRVLRTGFRGPDKLPYHLEIRTSTVERDELILDLSIALGILYIVVIASIFLLNQYVLTKAWKPFKKILMDLDLYRVGKSNVIHPLQTDVAEFKELYRHVELMIHRNEAVFAEQKLFIENASHELQTPLSITVNKIDLMMDEDTVSEKTLIQLAETKRALQRLINLNKSLLMLSRIENRQFVQDDQVNLNEITRELMALMRDMAEHKGLIFELQEHSTYLLVGNRDLLTIALSNLIRNAIRYSERGGKIIIEIDRRRWSIRNTGTNGALPESHIFTRFYKGSSSGQSTGLGLSIVHSIVQVTPATAISYRYENNFHLFSISSQDS